MSDNVRIYRAVRTALEQLYPTEPHGNLARHLNTLAGLVSGIVGSRRTNLPDIAKHAPDRKAGESSQAILAVGGQRGHRVRDLLSALC